MTDPKPPASLTALLDALRPANLAFMARHPGDGPGRQPVHVVYGGGHLFRAETAAKLGEVARQALTDYAPDPGALDEAIGLGALAEPVYRRVSAKLSRAPVEDFRIDFEDGYGIRSDGEEDRDVAAAAREVAKGHASGTLPEYLGIRVKPLTEELRARSLRTLRLFLGTLVESAGGLPPNFVVTLPKITLPEQVSVFAGLLAALERELGLEEGVLRFEVMIETPQVVLGADGTSALPRLVSAAAGRLQAAHFGTYDYTASLGITAAPQRMRPPACDLAKQMMKLAFAGTGERELHHLLREIARRGAHALGCRGDAERRRVIVGAEVRRLKPPRGGGDEPGERRRPVGAQHHLGRLDHDLEPQHALLEPELALERREEPREHAHLFGQRDLRERDDEVGRQPARGLDERAEEEPERSQAPRAELLRERLHPDAQVLGQRPRRVALRDLARRRRHVAVLLAVRPDAVAVLEVDPEIFDRRARELGTHAAVHRLGESPQPDRLVERARIRRVVRERLASHLPELRRGLRAEQVAAAVDHVHGLAARSVSRVSGHEREVRGSERVEERSEERRVGKECRSRGSAYH